MTFEDGSLCTVLDGGFGRQSTYVLVNGVPPERAAIYLDAVNAVCP